MESVDHFDLYFAVHTNVITRVNSPPLLPRHDVVLLGEFGAIVLCNGLGLQPTCRFGTGFNGIYWYTNSRISGLLLTSQMSRNLVLFPLDLLGTTLDTFKHINWGIVMGMSWHGYMNSPLNLRPRFWDQQNWEVFFNLSSKNPSGFGSVVHNIVKLIWMDGWMVSSYFLDMGFPPRNHPSSLGFLTLK